MKKIIIAAAVIAAMALSSCGNQEDGESVQANGTPAETTAAVSSEQAEAEASAADIASAVMSEIEIPSAVEKDADSLGAFYDIDVSTVADMSVFICGSGAYPDELAVFRFNDADSAASGAAEVQKRLESQIELYTDYTPDEVYKLEDAAVIEKGNWVVLIICSDNSRASEIVNGLI